MFLDMAQLRALRTETGAVVEVGGVAMQQQEELAAQNEMLEQPAVSEND